MLPLQALLLPLSYLLQAVGGKALKREKTLGPVPPPKDGINSQYSPGPSHQMRSVARKGGPKANTGTTWDT